jgi:hypothetical protein
MKENTGTACRIRNAGLMGFVRLVLLATLWPFGLYLLLGGVEPLTGLLCLFAGIWLLFDNPLEFFAAFCGLCPACGAKVTGRGRSPCRCPSCGAAVTVEVGHLHPAGPEASPSESAVEELAEAGDGSPFEKPLPFAPRDTLDLHAFSPKEVAPLLGDFLDLCEQAGINRVRIIHGKGTGVLRQRVKALLARDPRVISHRDAPPETGGWGATVVELRFEERRDGGTPSEE